MFGLTATHHQTSSNSDDDAKEDEGRLVGTPVYLGNDLANGRWWRLDHHPTAGSSGYPAPSRPSSNMHGLRYSFKSRLLVTTETELMAIINPAAAGGSRTSVNGVNNPAAKGSAHTLYIMAQHRFRTMRRKTMEDRCSATTTSCRSDFTKTTSAASTAT